MNRLTIPLLALLLAACNNDAKVAGANETDSTERSTVTLPYTVPITPDWEIGPEENVAIAMNALRSYELNDSAQMVALMADSIDFYYDGGQFKGTSDSFLTMMKAHRSSLKNVSIKMHDYESVKSKARNEEWVGMWYTETVTNGEGKVDSMMTMDDIRLVNGKIRVIDSKIRRLSPKKM